jgi:hypothetical protein
MIALLDAEDGDGHFQLGNSATQRWYRRDVEIVIDRGKRSDERGTVGRVVSVGGEVAISKSARAKEPISVNSRAMYRLIPVGEQAQDFERDPERLPVPSCRCRSESWAADDTALARARNSSPPAVSG